MTWVRSQYDWCELSLDNIVTTRHPGALTIQSKPFSTFRGETSSDELDMGQVHHTLAESVVFFQKQYLLLSVDMLLSQRSSRCIVFRAQYAAVMWHLDTLKHKEHFEMIHDMARQAPKKYEKQTKKEKRTQSKMAKVAKMINEYEFSMH